MVGMGRRITQCVGYKLIYPLISSTDSYVNKEKKASRRTILQAGAAVLGVGVVASTGASAQQKIEKSLVMYQEKPKGAQRCDNCLHWQPPASCAIVNGPILASAWCGAYAPKPS